MKLRLLAEPTGNETNKQTIKRDKTNKTKQRYVYPLSSDCVQKHCIRVLLPEFRLKVNTVFFFGSEERNSFFFISMILKGSNRTASGRISSAFNRSSKASCQLRNNS